MLYMNRTKIFQKMSIVLTKKIHMLNQMNPPNTISIDALSIQFQREKIFISSPQNNPILSISFQNLFTIVNIFIMFN